MNNCLDWKLSYPMMTSYAAPYKPPCRLSVTRECLRAAHVQLASALLNIPADYSQDYERLTRAIRDIETAYEAVCDELEESVEDKK